MIQSEDRRYFDGDEALTGVFVWDGDHQQRRPGVLVFHGGAGLDEHAKGRARRFAAAGYVAFACDMYGDSIKGKRDRIMQHIAELRRDRGALVRRAQLAIDQLMSHDRVDGRVVAVGYCLGGMIALESARAGLDLAGVVCVHGSLKTAHPAGTGSIKSRVLVCHGAIDPHSPIADVAAFVDEMNGAGADFQLNVYGGAMHGFTHEAAAQEVNGVKYNAAADTRSSTAVLTFFDELFAG